MIRYLSHVTNEGAFVTTNPPPSIEALRARLTARVREAEREQRVKMRSDVAQERAADAARIAAWRALDRWTPQAFVLRAVRLTCACGGMRTGDCTIYLREADREHQSATRLRPIIDAATFAQSELPRRWEWVEAQTTICPACVREHGFGPENQA